MSGEWIKHDGKCFPIPKGTLVDIKCRNGDKFYGIETGIKLEALAAFWRREGEEIQYDIIEYRVCAENPISTAATISSGKAREKGKF